MSAIRLIAFVRSRPITSAVAVVFALIAFRSLPEGLSWTARASIALGFLILILLVAFYMFYCRTSERARDH